MAPVFSKLFIADTFTTRAGWYRARLQEDRAQKRAQKSIRTKTHQVALENGWDEIEEEEARQKAWKMYLQDPHSFLQDTD
jgi:hypothetical protein